MTKTNFWDTAFLQNNLMWGFEPTAAATAAADFFAQKAAQNILIPGIGYGRNATAFLQKNMTVTGIEISQTAIDLASSQLELDLTIHHGSVADMPFDHHQYDGIFCHALIHLLDPDARTKLIQDCYHQLAPGGHMIFTAISTKAPFYGEGTRLGPDYYQRMPGLTMFFYNPESVQREFSPYGLIDCSEIDELSHGTTAIPFLQIICQKS